MKSLLALLALLPLLSGCFAPAPDVTAHYDPVSGRRTDLMENELPSPEPPRELIWLNASRVPKTYDTATYYLEIRYMAKAEVGWLDIQPGESLVVLADDQSLKLYSSGSLNMRKETKQGIVRESAIYQVTPEQLRQIAYAKKVRVRVTGQRGVIERQFAAENFLRFQQFITSAVGL